MVREAHDAYKFFSESDSDRRYRQHQQDQQMRAKRRAQEKVKEEPPKPKKGYAADDDLDLVLCEKSFTNRTIHEDLVDAPIRRLEEPYPQTTE